MSNIPLNIVNEVWYSREVFAHKTWIKLSVDSVNGNCGGDAATSTLNFDIKYWSKLF